MTARAPNGYPTSANTYAEGVEFQSPASRSARWVGKPAYPYTPKGFHNGGWTPFGVHENMRTVTQRALRDAGLWS